VPADAKPAQSSRPLGRVLGLIPAKGGSQRVARKNLRPLAGKPILQWTIEAALGSGLLHRVVVSTEDEEAARVALACGAEVPFVRPEHLARDPYGVADVCLHALDELEARGDRFDQLVVLLPTSPFRTARHIDEALQQYRGLGADVLMSVTRLDHSLLSAHVLRDGYMDPLHPEWIGKLGARADKAQLPALVKSNGAVMVMDVPRLRAERSSYVYPLAAYPMPWPGGLDLDTEEDFLLAEALLSAGRIVVDA
jgi:CMP-N-acetylneuraminic acid synthetase